MKTKSAAELEIAAIKSSFGGLGILTVSSFILALIAIIKPEPDSEASGKGVAVFSINADNDFVAGVYNARPLKEKTAVVFYINLNTATMNRSDFTINLPEILDEINGINYTFVVALDQVAKLTLNCSSADGFDGGGATLTLAGGNGTRQHVSIFPLLQSRMWYAI